MKDFGKIRLDQSVYDRNNEGGVVSPNTKVQSKKSKWQFRLLLVLLITLIVALTWVMLQLFSAKRTLEAHSQKLQQPTTATPSQVLAPATENTNPSQVLAPATENTNPSQVLAPATKNTNPTQTVTHDIASSLATRLSPSASATDTDITAKDPESSDLTSESNATQDNHAQQKQAPSPTKSDKPVFDFYNVLPTQQTAAPKPGESPIVPVQEKITYVLQVASYSDRQAAEQMRAQLILLGLTPKVDQSDYSGTTWYRVDIGPFTNSKDADVVRETLQNNDIYGSIIRQVIETQDNDYDL